MPREAGRERRRCATSPRDRVEHSRWRPTPAECYRRRHHADGRDLAERGSGTINLSTAAITNANIGAPATPILTTAGTIKASTGTSGIFITESDGANFTATDTGAGAISLTSTTGALNIDGATSTVRSHHADGGQSQYQQDSNQHWSPDDQASHRSRQLAVSSSSSSNLTDGFSSIIIGNANGTGAVTVNELTVSDPLTIRAPTTGGTITVNGTIVGLDNGSVTLSGGTGATPIILNAGITTAGNTITLNDNVGLAANVIWTPPIVEAVPRERRSALRERWMQI